MADHSDGNHYEEAQIALKKIKANTVSMEERQAMSASSSTISQFFSSSSR